MWIIQRSFSCSEHLYEGDWPLPGYPAPSLTPAHHAPPTLSPTLLHMGLCMLDLQPGCPSCLFHGGKLLLLLQTHPGPSLVKLSWPDPRLLLELGVPSTPLSR